MLSSLTHRLFGYSAYDLMAVSRINAINTGAYETFAELAFLPENREVVLKIVQTLKNVKVDFSKSGTDFIRIVPIWSTKRSPQDTFDFLRAAPANALFQVLKRINNMRGAPYDVTRVNDWTEDATIHLGTLKDTDKRVLLNAFARLFPLAYQNYLSAVDQDKILLNMNGEAETLAGLWHTGKTSFRRWGRPVSTSPALRLIPGDLL